MKQYYHLDENNVVDCLCFADVYDSDGNEIPNLGGLLCQQKHGHNSSEWKCKNYPVEIGDTYYPDLDEVYSPKPYPSWVHKTETRNWKSPIGDPPTLSEEERHHTYDWDEENLQWVKKDPAPEYL